MEFKRKLNQPKWWEITSDQLTRESSEIVRGLSRLSRIGLTLVYKCNLGIS